MPMEAVLDHLGTSLAGLSNIEAADRRLVKGPKVLSSHQPPSWFMLLLSVIPNPFNILLIFLAIINAAIPPPNWVSNINLNSVAIFWFLTVATERVCRFDGHGGGFVCRQVLARIPKCYGNV